MTARKKGPGKRPKPRKAPKPTPKPSKVQRAEAKRRSEAAKRAAETRKRNERTRERERVKAQRRRIEAAQRAAETRRRHERERAATRERRREAARLGWRTRRFLADEREAIEREHELGPLPPAPSPPKDRKALLLSAFESNSAANFGITQVRLESGQLVGRDERGQRRAGYTITKKSTGETSFYWTGPNTLAGYSPATFAEAYEIDSDEYDVEIDFSDFELDEAS